MASERRWGCEPALLPSAGSVVGGIASGAQASLRMPPGCSDLAQVDSEQRTVLPATVTPLADDYRGLPYPRQRHPKHNVARPRSSVPMTHALACDSFTERTVGTEGKRRLLKSPHDAAVL